MILRTPDIYTTSQFDKWYNSIKDRVAKRAINVRITRLGMKLFGDCKRISQDVSELRINVGPGYRIYFTKKGNKVILLLVGGDKSSQEKDIKLAKELAKEDIDFAKE